MSLASTKEHFQAGARFDLTNHYITRPDHPCFGTRTVTVERVTGGGAWIVTGERESERIAWPKATQVERDNDGTIRFYGGGINQAPTDLFLTFKPA